MSAALHRPGWFRVLLGAIARLLWMLFGVPCGWSLPRADRDAARWGAHFDVDGDDDDDDDAREADARESRLAAALRAAETHRVRHVVGAFDAHLAAVRDILRDWRASPSVALAGYAHTVYASELFPVPLAPFSRRRDVRALVGRAPSVSSSSTPPPVSTPGTEEPSTGPPPARIRVRVLVRVRVRDRVPSPSTRTRANASRSVRATPRRYRRSTPRTSSPSSRPRPR